MKNFSITDENKNLFVALVLFGAWFALVYFKVDGAGELIGAIKCGLTAVLFKHGGEHISRARAAKPPADAGSIPQPDVKGNSNATT